MLKKDYRPIFAGIFFLNFIFFLSHASVNMLPAYLSSLGASNGYIGLFMNINSFELLLFVILFGGIASRIARKPALVIGHLCFTLSMLAMFAFKDNLFLLFVMRLLSSISYVFGYTIDLNIVYDILPPEKRVRGVAFFGISGIIANPAGAFLGEFAVRHFGGAALFLVGVAVGVLCIFVSLVLMIPENMPSVSSSYNFFEIIKKDNLRSLLIIAFIFGGAYGVMVSFLPNYTQAHLGHPNLSYFFTTFSLVAIIFRIFLAWTMDFFRRKHLMIFSLIMILLSMINLIFLRTDFQLVITGLLYGIGHSILFPLLSTSFVASGGEQDKVILNNVFIAVNVAGVVGFAYALGAVSDYMGIDAIYYIFSLLLCVTLLCGMQKVIKCMR